MSLWEVEVTQTDCPHVSTTQKYPSARIIIMGTEVSGRYERLFSVFSCPNPRDLNGVLDYFQRDRRVKDFSLLSKRSGVAIALYLMSKTSMFKKTSTIGLRVHPVVVRSGREKWFIVTGRSRENIREFVEDGYTKVISVKRRGSPEIFRSFYTAVRYLMPVLSILDSLSDRDIELIRVAYKRGFFDWPRLTNLTKLSDELQLPKSTLSYRFRAVEKKMAESLD